MIIADASLVIAFLYVHDLHHSMALGIVTEHDDLLLHPVTMAEVSVGAARIDAADDLLVDLTRAGFRVDVADAQQSKRVAELRVRTGLKLPDCYPLDLAEVHRSPLATFDARLASQAREVGITVLGG